MPGTTYPPALKTKVYSLYMDTQHSLREIAEITDVNFHTINKWVSAEGWSAKRKALSEEMQVNTDIERRHVMMTNVIPVMNRHLKVTGALEDAALEIIEQSKENNDGKCNLTPRDISDLGKGLNQSASVSARVVGIDKSSSVESIGSNSIVAGSGSLIQIGVQPIAEKAPDHSADMQTIEAEYEEPPAPLTDFPEVD